MRRPPQRASHRRIRRARRSSREYLLTIWSIVADILKKTL